MISPEQVSLDGGILNAILRVFTRYSANDPKFPVNDGSLFTRKLSGLGAVEIVGRARRLTKEGLALRVLG